MESHPNLADVEAARLRIADAVIRTPLRRSAHLSAAAGADVHLKLENHQRTGSFKLRGATHAIRALTPAERARGVVAVSSGNHGRAVAQVAAAEGIEATVCLSGRVPPGKVAAIEALGARVVVAGPTQDDADAAARRLVSEHGLTFIHPFDDPRVIAGQGTVGLEIIEDMADVQTVIVPLSGGGLISGIAAVMKGGGRSVRVVGVSQDRGPAMHDSVRAGRLTDVVEEDTLADALAGGLGPVNHHTFAMCRALVDEIVLVTEEQIEAGVAALSIHDNERAEGGGAVGAAAILGAVIRAEGPCVVVVSGGNIAPDRLRSILDRAL